MVEEWQEDAVGRSENVDWALYEWQKDAECMFAVLQMKVYKKNLAMSMYMDERGEVVDISGPEPRYCVALNMVCMII